ncbi:hypothetical protein [Virgibacillus salexigens]|uniref:hypothetical protein n=1 Tax=Virgibacillus salexigens TaxID=61016 RepID=UPI00190C8CB2|nr:hypothetical protein [Virgibacillus salexigens]
MLGQTEYSVYYSKEGDPKKGKAIKNGEIKPLQNKEAIILNYEDATEGSYMFKVMQRPDYYGNNDKRAELWSEKINVACADKNKQANEDEKQGGDKDKHETETKAKQGAFDTKLTENQKQNEAELNGKTEDTTRAEPKTTETNEQDLKQSNQNMQVKKKETVIKEELNKNKDQNSKLKADDKLNDESTGK